jgi:hypothetical protein
MKDILIVTGTCGVGKSAVCWGWANGRHGAAINCDAFRTWIRNPWLRAADSYQEPLLARHAASLARDYLKMGLDVAIDNVWTPAGLDHLQKQLTGKGRIKVFWLNCSSRENHQRDRQRSPSDVMEGRLDELQGELEGMTWPDYVTRLDTTGQSLEATIQTIEESFQIENGV